MKLLLSLPFPSSVLFTVARLSGDFLCYWCHSFSWVTSPLVSQPCLLEAFCNTLFLMFCKLLMPFTLLPLLFPFGQPGSSSIRAEMFFSWLVHATHGQRNADKTPPKLPCPGSLVEELEALVQLILRRVPWRLKRDDLILHMQTELNWAWDKNAVLINYSSSAKHWLQVLVCTQISLYSLNNMIATQVLQIPKIQCSKRKQICVWIWLNHSFWIYCFVSNGSGLSTMWTINILCNSPGRVKWHKNHNV